MCKYGGGCNQCSACIHACGVTCGAAGSVLVYVSVCKVAVLMFDHVVGSVSASHRGADTSPSKLTVCLLQEGYCRVWPQEACRCWAAKRCHKLASRKPLTMVVQSVCPVAPISSACLFRACCSWCGFLAWDVLQNVGHECLSFNCILQHSAALG